MAASSKKQPTASRNRGRGRPWKPGQSGNPSGRAPVTPDELEVRQLARQHGKRAISRLAQLAESNDGRVAAIACSALLDRGYGRPSQALALEVKPAATQHIAEFPSDAGEAMRAYLALMNGDASYEPSASPKSAALPAPQPAPAAISPTPAGTAGACADRGAGGS
jgi:hypothetical protein